MSTRIELTTFGAERRELKAESIQDLRAQIAQVTGQDKLHILLVDSDEELQSLDGHRAAQAVAHKCTKAVVSVRMDSVKTENFPVSQTVRKVLDWATGKHGFNLDATSAAKANLILPGTDKPLDKQALIGQFVNPDSCSSEFVLTLKDFTNG